RASSPAGIAPVPADEGALLRFHGGWLLSRPIELPARVLSAEPADAGPHLLRHLRAPRRAHCHRARPRQRESREPVVQLAHVQPRPAYRAPHEAGSSLVGIAGAARKHALTNSRAAAAQLVLVSAG